MIQSFEQKELKRFFDKGSGKIPQPIHRGKVGAILDRLDSSTDIKDMHFPGSQLHKLTPKTAERWSVHVNGNWVITFVFKTGHAYNVKYEDYH